jgi:uncharacterized repeat protein (TIGR01451 family)
MKKILLICMLLTSWIGVYSQTSSLSIATTSTTSGCNGTIDGTVSIGSVNTTNTSEIDMLITPNQSTGTFNLILSVNWGDGTTSTHQGSGNYGSIGQFMSFNPPIQHTYSSYGNYTVTINYTSTNNGPAGTVTYTYSYNCPITNVYASLAVDCNQDGQTDYSVNDTVPITVVSSTGASYNGQLISNMATFSPALPSGLYTVVIDTNWLNTNNYSVSTNSFTTFQTSGNGGAYTVSFVFNCTTPPGCTTSITQGYNTASGSLMYSSSTPSQISSFVWNIYRYDNLGNQIGTSAFSTQANAYISNDPSISYVVACLDATFTNGCSFSTCDTFSVDNCISGTVYCDANSNGIFDSNENTISNAAIQIQTGNGIQTVYSDINGYYSLVYNSNNPIVINLNPNWSSMTGYTGGVYTLLSENCDSNQVYNVGLNCGSNLPANCYSGYVFCDANNNGVMNAGEAPIPFAPVYLGVSPTSNSSVTVYTDSTGYFSYCGQIGTSNIAVAWLNSQWLGYQGYTANSSLITLVGSATGNNQPGFLPVICGGTPCTDLWTTVTPWIGYYQNTTAHIKLNWGNYGPTAAGNYQLTLTFPAGVTVNTSSIQNSGYTISGNTITWNLSNLNTTFSTFDYITFQVPGGLLNGAQHYFTSTISPVNSTDCNSQNNAGSLLQILGNSYDPNDKTVQRPDFYTTTPISIGTEILDANQLDALTYTIRFQNTGTAPAQNVYILDTLSSNLDWSTFSLIHASHPVQVFHQSNGLVRFEFDQIWLADSTANEPESHGDLVYRIAEKSTCLAGCEIENTAYIYFDWNDAIVTNTTYNLNENIMGIYEDGINGWGIYPNPANNYLQIRGLETFNYQIHDFAGKSILHGDGTENEMLDITKLMSGAYVITIESENAELKVLRFVKN